MYGSDAEYATKPHEYKKCSCQNPEPHCWYCGKEESEPIHVMTVDLQAISRREG